MLTLLYVTNMTSRMWKCMGDMVSKHSSNMKSTSLFTCWPLGNMRTNFWTIWKDLFTYQLYIIFHSKREINPTQVNAYHKVPLSVLSIRTWNSLLFSYVWSFWKTLKKIKIHHISPNQTIEMKYMKNICTCN